MSDLLATINASLAGRYQLERELGSGGMATVYLAHELRHRRLVALKVLRPELGHAIGAGRFVREIEVAGRLTHPHILPVFDSGEAGGLLYYTMPLVEGESLRARLDRERQLPVEEAIRIVAEVADALTYAHERGVIHRDIKPENILLAGGHAMIMDFGVARAIDAAGNETLTGTGLAVGTPAYMSPEQAGADTQIDGRSDIYALGCVAYELLGGSPPFTGPSPQALLARHSVDPVPPLRTLRPSVGEDVERVIERALAKIPADRWPTATQFATALAAARSAPSGGRSHASRMRRTRAWATAAVLLVVLTAGAVWGRGLLGGDRIRAIAVLPLDDFTGDTGVTFFVAGLHEALVGELSQLGGLRVISRRSSLRYAGSDKSTLEIARELGVDAIVEGSVRRSTDSVRISLRLVDPLPAEHVVWQDVFARRADAVHGVHRDIARSMAREVDVELTERDSDRLAAPAALNRETYEAYLSGMYYLNQVDPPAPRQALEHFNEAIAKNPADPLAYAGLALGYAAIGHGPAPPADAWQRARAAVNRALRLDSTLAEAHAAVADIKLYHEYDWAGVDAAFRRAIELSPSFEWNHYHYSWYLLLAGRTEEAIAEHKRAQALDPLVPVHTTDLGLLYSWIGRHDDAIATAQKALEEWPGHARAQWALGLAYGEKGMFAEAIAAHEAMAATAPRFAGALGRTYALAGRRDDALRIVAQLEREPASPWNAWWLAVLHTALGNKDEAFRWLDYEQPHAWLPWVKVAPEFKSLRDDPRFDRLLKRLGLA